MAESSMRVAEYDRFGGPEVLTMRARPVPRPSAGQFLARVRAVALDPKDVVLRAGRLPHRLLVGSRFPKRVGYDWSGEIVALGRGMRAHREGDAVYGMIESWAGGACAEYVVVNPEHCAEKPASLSWEEAAAIPLAAQTALQALRDVARVQPRQHVLVNGASGGVGTFAVQIAKIMGCRVTAVSSARNAELVRSLGAEQVVDHETTDLRSGAARYDVFFDVFGNRSLAHALPVLTQRGLYISTVPKPHVVRDVLLTVLRANRACLVRVHSRSADLRQLATWVDAGALRPVIDRIYALQEIADAQRYLGTRRARGKVILRV
jgi:NADPH:quinone reductase-like Zn-dependent oxidoreductase